VALGDTVLADLRNDSLLTYTVQGSAGLEFAVFAQNESGVAFVDVWDAANPAVILTRAAPATDPAPGHLTRHRTALITIAAGQTLTIGVRRRSGRGRTRFWLYPVNRAPEAVSPALVLGTTIAGEMLENSADVDEFTIAFASGGELIMYGRRVEAGGPPGSFLSLHAPDGSRIDQLLALDETTDLQARHSPRIVVGQSGVHRVRISSYDLSTDSAGATPLDYEFQLRAVNRAPETAPAIVVAGDTVEGESIDYIGDADEFHVAVQAGEEYNLFLQSAGYPAGLELLAWPVNTVPEVLSLPGDSALANRSTGRFIIAETGTLAIRVEGAYGNDLRGPYRLFLYRVNRAPESAAPTFQVGESVSETIEYPGDVDEYTLLPAVDDSAQMRLIRLSGSSGMLIRWGPPGQLGGPCQGAFRAAVVATDTACNTGIVAVPAPGIVVQVIEQDGAPPKSRGAYSVVTTGITAAPEAGAAMVSVGDTMRGAIDVEADIDDFYFQYRHADPIDVRIVPLGAELPVAASVDDGSFGYYAAATSPTGRFTLDTSGTYRLRVSGPPGASYAVALLALPVTPETVPVSVTLADSITGESLDSLGDIDEFLLSAPPGTEVQAALSLALVFANMHLQTWLPGDTAPRSSTLGEGLGRRFSMPPGGLVRIRALEVRGTGLTLIDSFFQTGAYSVWFRTHNPAPESVPAALTLGVPITGESIDTRGDLDDFTFACSSGQVITGMITAWAPNSFSFDDPVAVQLLDPVTGEALASASTTDSDTESTGPVTLANGGTCRARVTTPQTTQGYGAYTVLVQ
jgi:hypothetical protein